jgi:SP family myo-inositol transporter-like MFS transporter 13
MSAGVVSVNFLCTFVGLFLVEKIGRRKLLLISQFGVFHFLAFLAVGFQIAHTNTPRVSVNETMTRLDQCSSEPDCSSCIFDTGCGFCYNAVDADHLAINVSPNLNFDLGVNFIYFAKV